MSRFSRRDEIFVLRFLSVNPSPLICKRNYLTMKVSRAKKNDFINMQQIWWSSMSELKSIWVDKSSTTEGREFIRIDPQEEGVVCPILGDSFVHARV